MAALFAATQMQDVRIDREVVDQHPVAGELLGLGRPSVRGEISRRRRHHAPRLGEAPHRDARVGLVLAGPDGDVDARFDEVRIAVGRHDLNRELWILRAELGQPRRDVHHRERDRTRDPEHAVRDQRCVGGGCIGVGHFGQHRGAAPVVVAAGVGEPQTPRRALDQSCAEARFERAQGPACRRVRHVEPLGRLRQASQIRCQHEEFDLRPAIHRIVPPRGNVVRL